MFEPIPEASWTPRRALATAALTLILFALAAAAVAGDQGPRRHAQGAYDASTATYEVAQGDDLDAIAARFGVTVEALKAENNLGSDRIDVGQKLKVAGASEPGAEEGSGALAASGYEIVSGEPGSPAAKATIDGKQLPPAAPPFGGVIKDDALESTPWWPPTVVPPKDAPNILLILTDDAGFAVPSTFGGVIPTPSMDRKHRHHL